MREAVQEVARQTGVLHHLDDVLLHALVVALEEAVRQQALADDVAHGHARVQRGIRVLEDQLQIAAEAADLAVVQAGQVHALVAQRFIALKLRIPGEIGAPFIQFGAHGVDLAVQIFNLHVEDLALVLQGVCLRALACAAAAVLLRLFGAELRIVDLQLDGPAPVVGLAALHSQLMLLQQQRHRLLDVIHRHKAADQVGHIQQRVVHGLVHLLNVVALLVLLFAVRQRIIRALDGLMRAGQLAPLCAALVDALQRLANVVRGDFAQRAAIVHRAAVRLAVQLQQRAAQRGLAAAALAHQTERLALIDI